MPFIFTLGYYRKNKLYGDQDGACVCGYIVNGVSATATIL